MSVGDGDTITVFTPDQEKTKVRLYGIDAPELAQPYGATSGQMLMDALLLNEVTVVTRKNDQYERPIGKILLHGVDVNYMMLTHGLAWHNKPYLRDQTPEDRQSYASAEASARLEGLGLWVDPNPVPPWVYRKQKRDAAKLKKK